MPSRTMIGRTLAHYHITAAIGAGGMGEVFRATDTRLGRAVALKVLPSDMARDPERLARFQREARAIAALNHPHIVTIYSVDEIDGIHFLTMELIEGESLAQLIPDAGLTVDRTLAIGMELADALAAAHDKGIVHRDLKPANVMMTTDGRVKVLDFGLAKELRPAALVDASLTVGGRTEIGVVMGTPAYMSPEQVAGRPMDHRTDIFSLGILLYQMASGQRPFEGATSMELASAILRDVPRPLTEIRADVPADLGRLIRRCLEKDVQRRVQTARDVGNELRDIAGAAAQNPNIARLGKAGEFERERRPADSGAARAAAGFWIVVRPFKYAGSDAAVAALADGLSEEIITGLARFSYLKVVARGAAHQETAARYVLEGSLRQAGSQLRLAVQLVDTSTGEHLWAETYNRALQPDALFDLQDDLVPRIVSTVADINGVLRRSMSETLRGRRPDQLTPYEAALRGFGLNDRVTAEEHAAMRDILEHAVRVAPESSDCWAILASVYCGEFSNDFNPRADPLGRALEAARRAVDAAPSSQFAHYALAMALFFRRELAPFRHAADRAVALNPMDGATIAFMGILIAYAGEWSRGCALLERAAALNPNHPGWYWFGPFYNAYRQGDYDAALDVALKINMPRYIFSQAALAAVYGQRGDKEAARGALAELASLKPDVASMEREWGKWFDTALVGQLMDGLRKAGLSTVASGAHSVSTAQPSIAVLPFANLSADKDQEYFSDGLAEDIINLLAQVSDLKVIARTSAFAFRGKDQDIREIAGALGVATVLQGSVRRAGSRIRVSAQLINASDGAHLWSERFDRELTEVFAVQDEIAAAIAGALKVKLAGQSAAARSHEPTLAAYDAFLKGKHHYYQFSPAHFTSAEQDFRLAIQLGPGWAEPHAALGDLYFALGFYGWRPLEDMIPLARDEARQALERAPSHPLGHAVLGIIAAHHDYNWPEAADQFRRVGSAESVHPNVHLLSLFYLLSLGRFDAALDEVAKAIAQDPLNSFWRSRRSWVLANANRYEESLAEARKALEFDATNYQARMMMALSYTCQGNLALALEAAEDVYRTSAFDAFGTGMLGGILSRLGQKDRAQQVVASMTGAVTIGMTMYHLVAGEIDAALDWYQKDIEAHRPNAPMVAFAAWLAPLRASPRWAHVAGMMKLPPASR